MCGMPLLCSTLCTVHTDCVIKACADCSRSFRTYVPDTMCTLPDGGSVFYRDPQLLCPLCDPESYGTFMNKDLFPELVPKPVSTDGIAMP